MRKGWIANTTGGFVRVMPDNVTLFVSPDQTRAGRPKRGTAWRAGATHWDETTFTASRYGRDVYGDLQSNRDAAMRLAESIYEKANAS